MHRHSPKYILNAKKRRQGPGGEQAQQEDQQGSEHGHQGDRGNLIKSEQWKKCRFRPKYKTERVGK